MRRFATLFITLSFALSGLVPSPAQAAVPVPADGTYLCTTGEASNLTPNFTITGGVVSGGGSCAGAVEIPAGVTSIGGQAFKGAASLTSILIPSSVIDIATTAFMYTSSLTTISLAPNSGLTSIGLGAFNQATSLTSMTIPASVTSIGDDAFKGAALLDSVYFLGNAPATVGTTPFANTALGAKAFIKTGASGFGNLGGTWNGLIVTNAAADGTYLCTTGRASSSTPNFRITNGEVSQGSSCTGGVVIPDGVTSIGSSAFTNSGITSIALPSSLISIGGSAFWEATSLTSITIPASVTSIGSGAFYKTRLTSVTLPSGLTSIEDSVFDLVTSLTSITIPESVTSIGRYAFYGASSLTSITIPSRVTNIGYQAFLGASSLTSVYFLGNAPTTVGEDPFRFTAAGAKAYIKTGASGFGNLGSTWNGLVVAVTTVTYNTNGGSLVSAQAYDGSIATPTAPTRTGYTFDGWSATNGGSVLTFPYAPASNSDVTLYAKWTAVAAPVVTPSPNNPYNEPNLGGPSPNVVTPSPNVVTPAPNVVTTTPNVVTPKSSLTTAKAISIQLPRFYISSSELTDSQKTDLKSLVSKSGKKAKFVITGSAGKLPGVSDPAVKALATKRGEIAKAYLVKLGVSKSKITIQVKITNQGIVPKTKILANYLTS